jgi:hypothetical protein
MIGFVRLEQAARPANLAEKPPERQTFRYRSNAAMCH